MLKPAEYTESGYRLYDDTALERLQQIWLFRELEFPLKEIKEIVTRPDFDKKKALEQHAGVLFKSYIVTKRFVDAPEKELSELFGATSN